MSAGTVLAWAGGVLAAFLVGSLNPATMIARLLGKDLASSGSGNPGATNAGRVLGRRWGVVVGVLDVLRDSSRRSSRVTSSVRTRHTR